MIYNNYPDDYIVINAKWVEWDNDEQRWFFMTEDAFEKAQSLSDYTKQVREEVVEEIREKFNDTIKHHFCPNPSSVDFIALCISEVEEFLDKVKGESNAKD